MSGGLAKVALLASGAALVGAQWYLKPGIDAKLVERMRAGFTRQSNWTGRLAPDFSLPGLDGSSFTLSEHIGRRVVVLNFFATWCGPCRAEMPELERYQAAHKNEPFVFVAVDVQEKPEVVRGFISELKLGMPVVLDEDGEVTGRFEVHAYPTTVVIGADGRVHLYQTGAISNADVAFDKIVPSQIAAIRAGRGIPRQAYLDALGREPTQRMRPVNDQSPGPGLEGRARTIAEKMPCPCGCTDRVAACSCRTARSIKTRLASNRFDDRSDAQIMEALNKEFCMKGM